MALPSLLPRKEIRDRLLLIFPEGTERRPDVTNLIAASTVFVALYIGATEGGDMLLQPKPIYRMTEQQAARTDEEARREFITTIRRPRGVVHGKRWYQDNTRESIRDDTIREGFVTLGAIVQKTDVAVTANKPRYVLASGFAALFDPALTGNSLAEAINTWRASAMSPGALARIALNRQGAAAGGDRVLITFPNGDTRRMRPGPSAAITKAVIESFAPRFLSQPTIIAISDSGDKVFDLDVHRAKAIGLNIKADQDLPDIVMVDLGPAEPLLVFVEVVATDGPISERRKRALEALVAEGGFPPQHVAFVTAYRDRSLAPFKKTVSGLAWGSYAWFASEPDGLIELSSNRKTIS
jgi:hypothetical protein